MATVIEPGVKIGLRDVEALRRFLQSGQSYPAYMQMLREFANAPSATRDRSASDLESLTSLAKSMNELLDQLVR